MIEQISIGIFSSVGAVEGTSRLIVDIALLFGLFVIVAMALNFQYGNAGIPNMGCAVQVIIGAFTSSAITARLAYTIMVWISVPIPPWESNYDWIYLNVARVGVVNKVIETNPGLGLGLFLFSIATSMVVGSILGYLMSLPAIRLRATYLMIVLITVADASQRFGFNIPAICGGTIGMSIPNVLQWYSGDKSLLVSVITLFIGLIVFLVFRTMLNSPYGRLMRSIRENEVTVGSVGKNVVGIRTNILIFASAITAVAGVLHATSINFVAVENYYRAYWTYWPWLMLILGGPGNNAGTFLGCALIVAFRKALQIYKWAIDQYLFFPVSIIEDLVLGILLVAVMIFRPSGLIPEKLLYIPGVNYSKLISEETKVDWRSAPKAGEKKKGKSSDGGKIEGDK